MADDKDEDQSQKTEEATEHRLRKAEEKGDVPLSREVNHLLILTAGAIVFLAFGPFLLQRLAGILKPFLFFSQFSAARGQDLTPVLTGTLLNLGENLALPFLAFIVAALFAGFAQTKGASSLEKIKPKMSKISVLEGFKRQFSMKNFADFIKSMIKISIVATVAFFVLKPGFDHVEALPYFQAIPMLSTLHELLIRLFIAVIGIMMVVAIADYLYQRYEFMKKMRMSRKDIRDEQKETEGDPIVRQRLKELRKERSQNRMMQKVPEASVVITNPTHYAVALKYHHGDSSAPVVVAKGQDLVAFRIRSLAEENEVPIVENPPLARALYSGVELNQEIPEKYYEAVAKVIRYVMGFEDSAA